MFKPNSKIVFSGHGVATVKRIDTKLIDGKSKDFYVLTIDNSSMTMLTPLDTDLIRPLVSKDQANEILQALAYTPVKVEDTTWNRRYREHLEDLKTGDLMKIAMVYKELLILRSHKDLSFGEKKMLDQARHLLTSEFQIALGMGEEIVTELLYAKSEFLGAVS